MSAVNAMAFATKSAESVAIQSVSPSADSTAAASLDDGVAPGNVNTGIPYM